MSFSSSNIQKAKYHDETTNRALFRSLPTFCFKFQLSGLGMRFDMGNFTSILSKKGTRFIFNCLE